MKPSYFSGAETDDENVVKIDQEEVANTDSSVDAVMNITFDNTKQVNVSDALLLLKSCFEQLSRCKVEDNNYSDCAVVEFLKPSSEEQQNEVVTFPKRQIEMVVLAIEKILKKQSIDDANIHICDSDSKTIYDSCITLDRPLEKEIFANSIFSIFTNLLGKRMSIKINGEPLNLLKKGQIVSEASGTTDSNWKEYLDKMFQKGKWYCSKYYGPMAIHMKLSELPYQVIVYECLPYIREEDNYLIETQIPLNDLSVDLNSYSEDTDILVFSCFNPIDSTATSWTGDASMIFHGVYRLDKGKSKQENYISFRLVKDYVMLRKHYVQK